MRIIAGKYKSRKINLPKNIDYLRPTSDRARETLFDVLSNIIDFENTSCLDLFAGSGALGFEALSRGADSAVFVDLSGKNLDSVKNTAAELKCTDRIHIYKDDSLRFVKSSKAGDYDLVLADPPYDYPKYDLLASHVLYLKPELFVLETASFYRGNFEPGGYIIKERKVGAAKFTIFISK
jgi:16S rRNA (guanine966-N2)-methyltransferase